MTKIGIIGAGAWSGRYAQAASVSGGEVVAQYADNGANLPGIQQAASAKQVIDAADVVLIASSVGDAAQHLAAVTAADKPALCESPVATSEADIEKLAAIASGKSNLFSSFPLRAKPEYQRLKAALATGELGTIGMIRLGICLPRNTASAANVLLDPGVHLLDLLDFLAGPVVRIYGAQPKSESVAYALLVARLHDGSIAHLEISRAEADGVAFDYYEVAGSDGLLEYDSRTAPLMRVEKPGAGVEVLQPGATVAQRELSHFLQKVTGDTSDFTSLERGLEMCRLALRLGQSVNANAVLTV